jgi:cell division protein FtsQ
VIAIWLYHSGNYHKIVKFTGKTVDNLSKKNGLVIRDILLEGQKYTPKEDILDAITGNKNIGIGDSIVNIDLWSIKESLENLPWVEHASVERQYPSTLSVSIIEIVPIALWQDQNKIYLIDQDGEVIQAKNIKDFSDLIILVGKDAPSHISALFEMISSTPEIADKVSSAIRVSKRRWNIRLDNGIEIMLPEEEATKSWQYIAKQHKDNNILASDIKSVDLRIENKMFVK